jgi:hypothetical protein
MVQLFLMVLALAAVLGWALESWSEKVLAQDSESVLGLRVQVLAQVLERVWDGVFLTVSVVVLVLVLAQMFVLG